VITDPFIATLQLGVAVELKLPQLADPGTSVVPAGTVSVSVNGSVDVESPSFWTSKVYVNGCPLPAVTTDDETSLLTWNVALLMTGVVTGLVDGSSPE
jgi:hypothetical protein